jgi:hypothetical protein
VQGGRANSRPTLRNESALGADHGIDTVRFRFREGREAYESLRRHPEGVHDGARGAVSRPGGLGWVFAYPDGMVAVEGRAAALASSSAENHGLLPPADLALAEQAARSVAEGQGVKIESGATLGRIDLASELRFADGDHGTAFLHALSSIDSPWCKAGTEGRKRGHLETVYLRDVKGRSIKLRGYDKGVESETAEPGTRIRLERQIRARKSREQSVAQFLDGSLRDRFLGRELRGLVALDSVVVADVVGAIEALGERCRSAQQRDLLAGFLIFGARDDYSDATWYRRASALRRLGIAIDPTRPERSEVPVGRYLRALAAPWEVDASASSVAA